MYLLVLFSLAYSILFCFICFFFSYLSIIKLKAHEILSKCFNSKHCFSKPLLETFSFRVQQSVSVLLFFFFYCKFKNHFIHSTISLEYLKVCNRITLLNITPIDIWFFLWKTLHLKKVLFCPLDLNSSLFLSCVHSFLNS